MSRECWQPTRAQVRNMRASPTTQLVVVSVVVIVMVIVLISLSIKHTSMSLLWEVLAGAVISVGLTAAITIHQLPKLSISVEPNPLDLSFTNAPANQGTWLRIRVSNRESGIAFLPRSHAVQTICNAEITNTKGEKVLSGPLRWASTPEPIQPEGLWINNVPTIVSLLNYNVVIRNVDIYPGDDFAQVADIAVRFDKDMESYFWNNDNYKEWRLQKHRLGQGLYWVRVQAIAGNAKATQSFMLDNAIAEGRFALLRVDADQVPTDIAR